ncbi:MAG: hypothetical protein J0L54_08250 [Chitinophagales bacterium]|nr:hypothetical protein [Chitinophagales bacterium]
MKKLILKPLLAIAVLIAFTGSSFCQEIAKLKVFTAQEAVESNSTIRINNSNRTLQIKLWEQNTVKVEFPVPDTLAKGMTEKNWQEVTGSKISKFHSRMDIVINGLSIGAGAGKNYSYNRDDALNNLMQNTLINEVATGTQTGKVITSQLGGWTEDISKLKPLIQPGNIITYQQWGTGTGFLIPVTIYLPSNASIELVNKYSGVQISGNIKKSYFNLTNTVLDVENAGNVRITSKFCTLNFGVIGECEADISNSTFRADAIKKMEIESTRSTVEYRIGDSIYIRSNLDNSYTIEEINVAEGRLLHSNVKLEKLNKKVDFDGNNYDLKIRQISPDAALIKINNSWADMRLPVRGLSNYTVNFDGKNCAVFAPFEIVPEKREEPEAAKPGLVFSMGETYLKNSQRPNVPRYFKASFGSASGIPTRFEITCQQCIVDFK